MRKSRLVSECLVIRFEVPYEREGVMKLWGPKIPSLLPTGTYNWEVHLTFCVLTIAWIKSERPMEPLSLRYTMHCVKSQ